MMDQIKKSATIEVEITEIHVHVCDIMQLMSFIVHVHVDILATTNSLLSWE